MPQVVNDKLMFVKVHLPWDVLCTYAEVLHIKLPIRPNDMTPRPSMWRFFTCITKHFYPDEKLIQGETEFFTAPFEKNRQDCFHIKDKDLFFTPSMRSRMVSFRTCSDKDHSLIVFLMLSNPVFLFLLRHVTS